jgi:hypothetical protein
MLAQSVWGANTRSCAERKKKAQTLIANAPIAYVKIFFAKVLFIFIFYIFYTNFTQKNKCLDSNTLYYI